MTIHDFEKIRHRLTDKELKGVRRYFGVKSTADVALDPEAVSPVKVTGLVEVTVLQAAGPTMSSNEIAQLTGKRHDNVARDIRAMLEGLNLPALNFEGSYKDQNNQDRTCFYLNRDLTETLILGYSIPLRHAVVVRLRELEAQVAKPVVPTLPDFSNPAEAARAWASEFEGRALALEVLKVKEAKITEDAPKVEFYGDVAVAEGSHTVKQIADMLKTGRNELYRFLRRHKVLIEHGKDHNLPYQVQKTAGRFTVLEEPYKHPLTGKITLGTRTMVTGKGLIFIRELNEEHNRVELDRVE
ncbi:phage antirepressor KilAC domain-containing protein [Pseudomonas sp. 43A]|uniref:phage antirepressor KilAC domain-containing protein n=1 Tax=unclassified Pseudomonas TaxID=196821 RepID=UPI001587E5C5|nr:MULTISPECIES: phage regulatory protein/antirepressor Ant [unclassified Pseudomonas]QKV65298.1 phage antirepressor KilAC domain-containing protein [Pseudomonas sp. 43A]QMW12248.1 phage antirepressor KilAC domain-containing protein [Pseudomonas sp. 29A]